MARTPAVKPEFTLHSFPLTKADKEILEDLSQSASDHIGRKVSASAIVRALIRQAAKRQASAAELVPLIEAELRAGIMWGRKRER